eukprot:8921830-Pyramimonas_sp.AAC.1
MMTMTMTMTMMIMMTMITSKATVHEKNRRISHWSGRLACRRHSTCKLGYELRLIPARNAPSRWLLLLAAMGGTAK